MLVDVAHLTDARANDPLFTVAEAEDYLRTGGRCSGHASGPRPRGPQVVTPLEQPKNACSRAEGVGFEPTMGVTP